MNFSSCPRLPLITLSRGLDPVTLHNQSSYLLTFGNTFTLTSQTLDILMQNDTLCVPERWWRMGGEGTEGGGERIGWHNVGKDGLAIYPSIQLASQPSIYPSIHLSIAASVHQSKFHRIFQVTPFSSYKNNLIHNRTILCDGRMKDIKAASDEANPLSLHLWRSSDSNVKVATRTTTYYHHYHYKRNHLAAQDTRYRAPFKLESQLGYLYLFLNKCSWSVIHVHNITTTSSSFSFSPPQPVL